MGANDMENEYMIHNIALLVEYDGTPFCGWQSQTNGKTIQDMLLKAVYEITGEKVRLNGCSRTDAGVHAAGHVSNFFSATTIYVEKIPLAMNSHLPREIAVRKAVYADAAFHARFCATGKHYRYSIWNAPVRTALYRDRAFHAPRPLDIRQMKEAAGMLAGTRDFASFMGGGAQLGSTIRTLWRIDLITEPPWIHMDFYGDGFLYNMVRILAGTLYYVGLHKIDASEMETILECQDRTRAGKTLPACGLTLIRVYYEQDLFNDGRSPRGG